MGVVANGNTAYLAAEYLVKSVGEEAAQKANLLGTVWVEELVDSLTAHFRYVNPMNAPTSVNENTTLPSVSWSPTGVTISAGLAGLAVQYSKLFQNLEPDTLGRISQAMSNSLSRYIDSAIAAQFVNLTGGTVGTSGAAFTVSAALAAEAILKTNFADQVGDGQLHAVLHPHVFLDLYQDIMSKNYGVARINVNGTSADSITIGSIVFQSNALVPTINSNADYAGAVYNSEAIGLAIAESPSVEVLHIPTQHSWSIDGTVALGAGVVRPTLGVLIQSGKTA